MAALALLLVLISLAPPAMAASPVTIVITDALQLKDVTIEPGTTVTWRNDDRERHRIASVSGPVDFDSGNLDPGQAFSMSFDTPGTYSYVDDRDEDNTAYHGTITVSTEAPPPTTPPSGGGGGGDVTVDVVNRLYHPASITIEPGTTVLWDNIDDRPHTVTARDGSFDSGIFDTGGTYTRTFNTSGTFEYWCVLHPDMVGTVTVTGSGGTPPPTTLPPPDPGPSPEPPPTPTHGDVAIFDNGYTPASMTITPGSTVTWVNTGSLPHTATDTSGRFDSGFLLSGQTYSRTFASDGTYNYLCTIHPEMTATVVVGDGGGAVPPPPDLEPEPIPPDPGETPAPYGDIIIVDNAFKPATKTVTVGARVRWANTGTLLHTVTDRAGAFDSGLMMSGETYSRLFSAAGTFNYICTLHPEMVSTLIVTGSDGTAPPAQDPVEPGQPGTSGPAASGPSDVRIVDNDYRPRNIEVGVGSILTWVNTGALPHTVTDRAGRFDSDLMMAGDAYRRTFNTVGTFDYYCTIHPEMAATVKVTEGAAKVGSGDAEGATSEDITAIGSGDLGTQADVDVIDLDYDPRELTVVAGATVVWINVGDLPHTVTAEGLFDSGLMMSGDRFTWTFDNPGTYDYLCTLHPGMVGTVIVEDGSGTVASSGSGVEAAPKDGMSSFFTFVLVASLTLTVLVMAVAVGRATRGLRGDPAA